MNWLRRIFDMFFNTKSVRDLRSQQEDLRVMVAMAKRDEKKAIAELHATMQESRETSKYRPSKLAAGFGWKPYD